MKQHRQSDQGRTTPGRNHATQPGGPGAVPTHPREMGDKAAPGTYHDDWKHKDRRDA